MKDRMLRDHSLSAATKKVKEESAYQRARDRQFAQMEKGFDLGTKGYITVSREDLHARR